MADDESNDQETGDNVEETDEAGPADDDLEDAPESPLGDADDANSDGDDDAAEKDSPRTKPRKTDDEEDDDDDLVDDDDVEADLDRILKDRMVTEEEEEEAGEPDDRSEGGNHLQPKQQDEQLCSACFLLVRSNAPNCPVGDDDCPIFS